LQGRREALGLTLPAVAAELRIPIAHLEAFEAGRYEAIPSGPYAHAYWKALEDAYNVAEDGEGISPDLPPAPRIPVGWVRVIAGVSAIAAVLAMAIHVSARGAPGAPRPAPAPAVAQADQHLVLQARQTVDLVVRVDGETVTRRQVPGGERLKFHAHDRIEVDVPAVDAVKLEFNGETIVPQGRQDVPRRLVFEDEGRGR
jgi:hypothetical protein